MDVAARAANLNSDPAQPVLSYLDFASSSWWLMQPGDNDVRYDPATASAGAEADITFRGAWIP